MRNDSIKNRSDGKWFGGGCMVASLLALTCLALPLLVVLVDLFRMWGWMN